MGPDERAGELDLDTTPLDHRASRPLRRRCSRSRASLDRVAGSSTSPQGPRSCHADGMRLYPPSIAVSRNAVDCGIADVKPVM